MVKADGRDVWLREDALVRLDATPSSLRIGGFFRAHSLPSFVHLPCHPSDALEARAALDERLGLPKAFTPVTIEALLAAPVAFDGARIDCVGTWEHGFERSCFATAWVTAPFDAELPRGGGRLDVRLLGRWRASQQRRGFGHLGASPAAFEVFDSVPRLPGVAHTWIGEPTPVH